MATLDALNARFGRGTVQLAASGVAPRWVMRADRKTPRYTTCWDELPIALAC
jgi:DNA polymerase V